MELDRLTQRARTLLNSLSTGNSPDTKVKVRDIVEAVVRSDGLGKTIVQKLPEVDKLKKSRKTLDINEVVKKAYYLALKVESTYVGTEHIILAVLDLLKFKNFESIKASVLNTNLLPNYTNGGPSQSATPLIDTYGTVLNHEIIRRGNKPLVYRKELEGLISVLLQKKNNSPLLVGDANVGKRSLVDLFVQRTNNMDVPPELIGYRTIEFDLLSFVTGNISKGGNPDYGISAFFEELKDMGRVILSIRNFQNLFYSTNMGVAVPLIFSSFKDALEDYEIPCIATISETMYNKLSADNEHILEHFTVVSISEPDEKETKAIIKANASSLSKYHQLEISDEVVEYIYDQSQSKFPELKFPQKGIDLLDQACAGFILRKRKVPESYKDMVEDTVTLTEGLDKSIASEDYENAVKIKQQLLKLEDKMWIKEKRMFLKKKQSLKIADVDYAIANFGDDGSGFAQDNALLGSLDDRLSKIIIGQQDAVETITKSLIRSQLGLRDEKLPLGCFLFLGPTGVGKTELAKVLASQAFDDNIIRLDMSDFAEKHNVARLVGAPPGYVGYGEGGELTTKIDSNPNSVVLFDEIEKAHPDVLNILLQIMDEGELVDARGNSFDFSQSVVVLTSNLGTDILHKNGIGFDEKKLSDLNVEDRLKSNLKKILKPELLNRLDEVIVFKRLKKTDQLQILGLMLEEIRQNLQKQDLTIRISGGVKKFLLEKGYSDEYGARALRRTVEREFLDKIAEILLKNEKRPLKLSATCPDNKGIEVAVVK